MSPSDVGQQRSLMRAMAQGDQKAFSDLYDQLSDATYAICRHHLGTGSVVDGAMHSVWLYIWQNAQSLYQHAGSPSSTIIATADRQARAHRSGARFGDTGS
jgi:DNA-directed RNA polymerase specialized sigma24 family protein